MTSYSLRYALWNFLREKWINFLSILTIAMSLLIITLTVVVAYNAELFTEKLPERFSMIVYLNSALSKDETQHVIKTLQGREEILSVKYTSKEEALRELKRTLKDAGNVLEGLDENPLSASVEIRLNRNVISASKVKSLSTAIKQIAGVDDVYYGEKIAEALHILKTSLHGIGIVMLAVVFAGILFVIYSTVKILFYRKKDEIETLKLLGATALFIRAPFLIEGGLIGLLGGTLGGAAAIALAVILEQRLSTAIPLLKSVVFPIEIAISLPIVGIVLGIAGAIIAVGRLRF